MIFYGLIALGLLIGMAGLSYLFPEYALRLLAVASSRFWELFKPELFKRMSPKDEAEWDELQKRGASKEEMLAWQRRRRRRKLQKGSL